MTTRQKIERLTALLKKVHLPWTGGANVPFYVEVTKPRPSMSKHDGTRPTYWGYDDGEYLYCAVNDVPALLARITTLEEALRTVSGMRSGYYDHEWSDVANKVLADE